MGSPVERLLAKIDIREDGECWPWKGYTTPLGYGRFRVDAGPISAHRAVALLLKGEHLEYDHKATGSQREVIHKCNSRNCCNPTHLVYSNHSENMKDRVAAGTHNYNTQKLTPDDYITICTSSEPTAALARRFDITVTHVNCIRRGVR